VFRHELDGAYLGHVCAIDDPADAREFAVDLIVGELRNVIAVDETAEGCMGEKVLLAWVDQRADTAFHVADGIRAPAAVVKDLLREGTGALPRVKGRLIDAKGKEVQTTIKAENLGGLFYETSEKAWNSHLEFARLSSFKREAFGHTQLPNDYRPTLTLGTVIKLLGPKNESEQAKYAGLTAPYYVCMQPRCDSVRLEDVHGFPFQTAEVSQAHFNLVVKERGSSSGIPLLVNGKPGGIIVLRFAPDAELKIVRGESRDEGFVFTDEMQREFLWLGDIRDLKAQQDASALAASVHRVGLNEHEWLRRAARKETKITFRPTGAV
jgi:hypothetical protein